MDVDVTVVGAGPTGLMLAGELALAGVRVVLLERRAARSDVARAGGLAGQALELLHLRGDLGRFRDADADGAPVAPLAAPQLPFGGLQLDFAGLDEPPLRVLRMPQAEVEGVLQERAVGHGAEVRRGHAVERLSQDAARATVGVVGPDGAYELSARFVVGCDGGRSRVRALAGIGLSGTSLPEVERLTSFTVPDGVLVREDGGLEVAGVGVVPFGYTATERGVFACAGSAGAMSLYTAEVEPEPAGEDAPMTPAEMAASVRRVLGVDLPLGEPLRMTRFGYSAAQADAYRSGRVLVAGDAAHLFPAGGVAVTAGLLDAADLAWKLAADVHGWAPPGLVDSYASVRRRAAERTLLHTRAQVALRRAHGPFGDALRALVGELAGDEPALRRLGGLVAGADTGATDAGPAGSPLTCRSLGLGHADPRLRGLLADARPVLLDLSGRPDLRRVAEDWGGRLLVRELRGLDAPVDALLVLPDATVAWATDSSDAGAGADAVAEATALRGALALWLGEGRHTDDTRHPIGPDQPPDAAPLSSPWR